jgi:hypothetical protein
MFDAMELPGPDRTSAHFELVCCKCVDTYVTVKRNQNQICWKFTKVCVCVCVCVRVCVCVCAWAWAGVGGACGVCSPTAAWVRATL